MRSKFYLYVSGNENDIRNLCDTLNLSGSEIKPLLSDEHKQKNQWMWYSQYQECSSEFPEDELSVFLHNNQDILHQLKESRDVLHELVGVIVCQLDKGESPRGYSISSDLMKLLSISDMSLEIDIEQY